MLHQGDLVVVTSGSVAQPELWQRYLLQNRIVIPKSVLEGLRGGSAGGEEPGGIRLEVRKVAHQLTVELVDLVDRPAW